MWSAVTQKGKETTLAKDSKPQTNEVASDIITHGSLTRKAPVGIGQRVDRNDHRKNDSLLCALFYFRLRLYSVL